ncbi:MAG: serine hydrolase [Anaerolineae bacterium]|nr:serine hydrolase [Anaerolineae bacterium]
MTTQAGRVLRMMIIVASALTWLLMATPPRQPTAAQMPLPAFDTLPPCNFNAYTDRDDLIIGGVVLNLNTGDGCAQNLNTTFQAASLPKLFIAATFYERVALGLAALDDLMEFNEFYYMAGNGDCLNAARLGELIPMRELVETMIWCSDNPATWMVMDYLGWSAIQGYIDSLGIDGIGPVIPYSEVDRIKLTLIDPRWANVPAHLASQFYRQRITLGLVPDYFPRPPNYEREEIRDANAHYQESFNYNTLTPRAMATYLLKLAQEAQLTGTTAGYVAQSVLRAMLLTQRMFSSQEFPGTVYVGSKNGFDMGIRAEASITIRRLYSDPPEPETFSVILARHRDLTAEDVPPQIRAREIESMMARASRGIQEILYPFHDADLPPVVQANSNVAAVIVNREATMRDCWRNYQVLGSAEILRDCWRGMAPIYSIELEDTIGVGVVFQGLQQRDVHLTLVYTLPDGSHYAYQQQRFLRESVALAWFEPIRVPGVWRIDVYYDLIPVYSQSFLAVD